MNLIEAIERFAGVRVFTHQFSDSTKTKCYEVVVESYRPIRAAGHGNSYISVQDALDKAVKEHDHNYAVTSNSASETI